MNMSKESNPAPNPATRTLRVGCELVFEPTVATTAVIQVQPRREAAQPMLRENLTADPRASFGEFHDLYGNLCQRFILPGGRTALTYDAQIQVKGGWGAADPGAAELAPDQLPPEFLHFTLPSRYCLSDVLGDTAWQLFGSTNPGWGRVQAICDWVHQNIRFQYGSSTPRTTAVDVFDKREGVCRDFAHLAVTFCRAFNIPARYVFGYIPDIGVPPSAEPMDFCAWFEAYLGDRWRAFDARNNIPRIGRCVIGRGRDALDVAMVTTYGSVPLTGFTVWAEEVGSPADEQRQGVAGRQ